jgi:hypothetical protein
MAYVEILVYAAEKEIWERITEPGDKRFRFRAIETYEELSKNIKENPFQIVLVSEKEFKANPELSALVRQKEYLFILYSGSFSAEEKSEFLRRGIWCCWSSGDGIRPFYRKLELVLKRNNLIAKFEKLSDVHGNFSDLPFSDLLISIANSGKNVKLELFSTYGRVNLFFKSGTLVHARHGRLVGNEAVLNVFLWQTGTYFFQALPEHEITPSVTASVVALIAEGIRRRNYFWNYWAKKYNPRAPMLFHDPGNGKFDSHILKIKELINGQNGLLQILLSGETEYPILISEVEKLVEKGIIIFKETETGGASDKTQGSSFFSRSEAIALEQIFFAGNPELNDGVFLIACVDEDSLMEVIKTLSGKNNALIRNIDGMIISDITLRERTISLTGIKIDDGFMDKIGAFVDKLVGLMFLIDVRESGELEYSSYLVNFLLNNFSGMIYTISMIHTEKARALPLDLVLAKLKIPDFVSVIATNIESENSLRELIFSLKEIPAQSAGGANA